jgi:hypothetical protein
MDKPTRPVPKTPFVPGRPPQRGIPISRGSQARSGNIPPPVNTPQPKMGSRPPWYKRKYLVYPQFQMTLIVLNTLVTMALFGLIAYLVIRSHLYLENLVKQTRLPAQNLFIQLLTEQLRSLLIYMFISLGVGIFITATLTLMLSHKMAGPMVRLRNLFVNVSKTGDFPEQLKFRDGDFFQELPPAINQAFTILKKKWQR